MAYSEAQKMAVKKYNESAYDEIKVRVKKGDKKLVQKHAESKHETVNQLINRLLETEIPEMQKFAPKNQNNTPHTSPDNT